MRVLKLYILGIWNLVVKVGAKYIKGMLSNRILRPQQALINGLLLQKTSA